MSHVHDSKRGWIGVDFDGTVALYDRWRGADHVGEPISDMVFRIKRWLAEGREVRIFTARVYPYLVVPPDMLVVDTPCLVVPDHHERIRDSAAAVEAIREWCLTHVGQRLTITCVKDYAMVELWDDRAVQVEPNTGVILGRSTRGLS